MKIYNTCKNNINFLGLNKQLSKEIYKNARKDHVKAAFIVSSIILGISLIEIYLMMRSSFLSRIKEVGILRAIGSRSIDVFKIFFAESFIISMINLALSLTGTLTVTLIINHTLRSRFSFLITILRFGPRQVIVLLIISLAVAAIATFLPVNHIAKKKPIDAIRNR